MGWDRNECMWTCGQWQDKCAEVKTDDPFAEIERLRAALREARQAINDYGLDDFEETTHETLAKIDEALRD